ncbi:MAG: hypothetical protein IJ809_00675 [Clostridia bacterium]|nr:hypothetical protein [Clostridia bacterium]
MKKGISLIVLVITIIIIIILAGAVILNLSNNNPIDNANKAALLQEEGDLNSGAVLWLAKLISDGSGNQPTITGTTALTGKVGTDGNVITGTYWDLANVTVTPKTVDATGAVVTGTAITGYAPILSAIGMTPTKAGATMTYKIAMNEFGNIKFYTDAPAGT